MKKTSLILLFIALWQLAAWSCTTAVISGKYTANGRPMIWKLRDTESYNNKMMYFDDGKYDYIGMVNADDDLGEQIWGGSNSMGLAIMNSASFNVNMSDTTKLKDQEGHFMKRVLQSCATLADVEALLHSMPKPWGLAAHFGVIDAEGGAAFYEVNNYAFTRFDANEASTAPQGYIIRTNFSFTGEKDGGYGYVRYQTAKQLFANADAQQQLCAQTIIQDFSRCFKHAVLQTDYREMYEDSNKKACFVNTGDLITRHGSASCIVVEGVKAQEPKDMATIWVQIGFPNTCVALPLWVAGGKNLPSVLMSHHNKPAPLAKWALTLKKECYPIERSSGYKYMHIYSLFNGHNTGYIQQIEPFENKLFANTHSKLLQWYKNTPSQSDIEAYYKYLNTEVTNFYQSIKTP